MTAFSITVDADDVVRLMARGASSLDRLVEEVAEELSEELRSEGRQRSARLGEEWPVEGAGDQQRRVEAPEWWTHFVTGGTQAHGPRSATRMVFAIDGNVVSATHVRGVAADPFDRHAIDTVQHRVDDIMRRLIGGL